MASFKVGDHVRLTGEDWEKSYGLTAGQIVVIDEIDRSIWAGEAGTVGNSRGLYSKENPEGSGDYACELVPGNFARVTTPRQSFKVGDRVRFTHDGDEGIVRELRSNFGQDAAFVDFEGDETQWVDVDSLELVEVSEIPDYAPRGGASDHFKETRAKLKEIIDSEKTTAVNPEHYSFPGGAEVIGISQWLTANSAQAVQYVCRSSRIDGKNKGDTAEDIQKAITFLEFELKRIKETN